MSALVKTLKRKVREEDERRARNPGHVWVVMLNRDDAHELLRLLSVSAAATKEQA